ncbi:hypothetical protein [Desmospora profundinema]|uniref:DUF3941 domain-containing protein n=1 Tax=Desmospora profundinema TaxID=1571184 RepID=A0ABU1IIX4_9BACL|nr:hypothetical protein [Desmospora profundinema]MDR6224708.1 hypothetical protein [Desmospora profundinema]
MDDNHHKENESREQRAKQADSAEKREELKASGYGNKKLEGPNRPST